MDAPGGAGTGHGRARSGQASNEPIFYAKSGIHCVGQARRTRASFGIDLIQYGSKPDYIEAKRCSSQADAMNLSQLPALNAALNSACAVLLTIGFIFIRRRRMHEHAICMVSAFCVSVLFLVSYLYYHAHAGVTRFPPRPI